ncbi:MAG: dihydroneopterin aldolase [Marinifilaceae bacterium]|nr:dihydroneopterin aldolase [Marinifilaceae bacterium]
MDAIINLENLEFRAFHGCYDVEHVVGNDFRVDVELRYCADKAIESDSVADALNYQRAYKIVSDVMMRDVALLERVCATMLDELYANFPELKYAKVKVAKLNPPLGGKIGATAVSMEK